MSNKKP